MKYSIYVLSSDLPDSCIKEVENYLKGEHSDGTAEMIFTGDRKVIEFKTKYFEHAIVVFE